MGLSLHFRLMIDYTARQMVVLSGFFGVFIVPKICSSYSAQLTAYGKFPDFDVMSIGWQCRVD